MKSSYFVQLGLLPQSSRSIPLVIDPSHPLVKLSHVIDWEVLIAIARKRRQEMVKSPAGVKPHLRANVGAVVVRVMKSCDLRSAEDLIANYLPARYLCDLHDSTWTPDFRTLSDFEVMLGEDGLREINTYILQKSMEHGFSDVRGLCSDTTAQEAKIPYPNEVGLMNTLARSAHCAISQLGRRIGSVRKVLIEKIRKVKKLVRRHRLFAKGKEQKKEIEKELLKLSVDLVSKMSSSLQELSQKTAECLRGHEKRAMERLLRLTEIFQKLSPQIGYYIRRLYRSHKLTRLCSDKLNHWSTADSTDSPKKTGLDK